jgi:chromate transport protein ChrA
MYDKILALPARENGKMLRFKMKAKQRSMSTGVTPIVGAVVGAAAFTFFAGNPGGGFMIYLIAPFLLIWLLYTVYVFWRRPQRRRIHGIATGIWLLAIAVVAGLHARYYRQARQSADAVVAAVMQYKQQHGEYPASEAALGIAIEPAGIEHATYLLKDGKPGVTYASTFRIFGSYSYNFETRQWDYYAD